MLIKWAVSAAEDVDMILYIVDVSRRNIGVELTILDLLKKAGKPVVLLLNKIDMVAKETLLPVMEGLGGAYPFEAIIPISAKFGDGVELLLEEILRLIPEGPMYYDGKAFSDQSKEEIVSELIREKIFLLSEQEIPYSTAVNVDEIIKEDDKAFLIRATIFVEKSSQKGIVLGKKGRFIKKIRKLAERDLRDVLGKKVRLDLWVKVAKDWTKDEKFLKQFGIVS
jgi:GTP-binding protein Era